MNAPERDDIDGLADQDETHRTGDHPERRSPRRGDPPAGARNRDPGPDPDPDRDPDRDLDPDRDPDRIRNPDPDPDPDRDPDRGRDSGDDGGGGDDGDGDGDGDGGGGDGDGDGDGGGGDGDGDGGGGDDDLPELDDVDVRDLLRRALDKPAGRGAPKSVLASVQRRLREETKGRYFADGWSTSPSPRETFIVTSLIMLVIVAVAWFLLGPRGIHRL